LNVRNGWWARFQKKKKADWPRMEQGVLRTFRAVHPFDERYGTDTSGLLYELPSGHDHDAHNNGYFAVAPSVFRSVMDTLRGRLELDFSRFHFVDLGSGKGRALLLATEYPFVDVTGVELSAELEGAARANIALYPASRRGTPVISLLGDAGDFVFPSGPLIVYMWNAFTEPVLEKVLHNLAASLLAKPRELYLVYIHPELEMLLSQLPWLQRLWREEFRMNDEDFSAWAFPEREELCAVYQAVPAKVAPPGHTKV
jgi:SAM-dependent methyltransferase